MLTTRQYEIMSYVLGTRGYVTMSAIASHFRLSTRTVQRDMDTIHGYLASDGALIEKKTGYGVRFCGCEADRLRLMGGVRKLSELRPVYSQEERVSAILLSLLTETEPRKIYTFTHGLGVTETTVGMDLNLCEAWLRENGIDLVRKPGVGIYVKADEWQRRQALVRLYYSVGADEGREKLKSAPDVKNLLGREKLSEVDALIDEVELLSGLIQNDRSRGALVIHLCMILLRVSQGSGIDENTEIPKKNDRAAELSDALIDTLEKRFHAGIPRGERAYLAALLRTAKGLGGISDDEAELQAQRVSARMIRMAEARTGVMIDPNGGFSEALKKHLIPTIARLKVGMDIRNPILEDVKLHYGELYELARECAEALKDELHLPVPDSELGYLAVHLGVALEDSRSFYARRCRAVVCCPSGMVTAQLLALRVNREFPEIETADVVPTANLDYEKLAQSGVEMIISTVPLTNCSIPCVYVSPFLTDKEKDAVWQLLKFCKSEPQRAGEHASIVDLATTLSKTRSVIDTILSVLANLFIEEGGEYDDMESLIDAVASRTAASDTLKQTVREDLMEREKYGSTVTADCRAALLHCRTEGVERAWFGLIRPRRFACRYRSEIICPETVLVMLAPKSASRQAVGALGAISRETVESEAFMETLRRGDHKQCYCAIEQVLNAYYNECIRQ